MRRRGNGEGYPKTKKSTVSSIKRGVERVEKGGDKEGILREKGPGGKGEGISRTELLLGCEAEHE